MRITSTRCDCTYRVFPFASDWPGKAFHLAKLADGSDAEAESYDVFAHHRADSEHCCTCKGFLHAGHCKHVLAVLALIANGWDDLSLVNPDQDIAPVPADCPVLTPSPLRRTRDVLVHHRTERDRVAEVLAARPARHLLTPPERPAGASPAAGAPGTSPGRTTSLFSEALDMAKAKKTTRTADAEARRRQREIDLMYDGLKLAWDDRDRLVATVAKLAELVETDPDPLVTIADGVKALIAKHFPGADSASVHTATGGPGPGVTFPVLLPAPATKAAAGVVDALDRRPPAA